MKKIFILSFIVSLFFVSQSYSQWWVDGGNLIWPYGDVTISNDLAVNGTITNDGVRPYKVYTANIIIDEETPSISAIVIENTLGKTITWSNHAAGRWWGVLSSAYNSNESVVCLPSTNTLIFSTTDGIIGFSKISNDTFELTEHYQGSFANVTVVNYTVEIRVYP